MFFYCICVCSITFIVVQYNNNFCYRGTSFKVQGGSVIAAFFWAHNYVREQFGNYVEYGIHYSTSKTRLLLLELLNTLTNV